MAILTDGKGHYYEVDESALQGREVDAPTGDDASFPAVLRRWPPRYRWQPSAAPDYRWDPSGEPGAPDYRWDRRDDAFVDDTTGDIVICYHW